MKLRRIEIKYFHRRSDVRQSFQEHRAISVAFETHSCQGFGNRISPSVKTHEIISFTNGQWFDGQSFKPITGIAKLEQVLKEANAALEKYNKEGHGTDSVPVFTRCDFFGFP